jgi:N6-adenosine-specific RNA methylase IME4
MISLPAQRSSETRLPPIGATNKSKGATALQCALPAFNRRDEIAALPVADIAADNAILWFWTHSPLLVIGAHIPIMRAWGFKPTASGFVWVKIDDQGRLQWGTGFTTRKNCECCANAADRCGKRLTFMK